MKKLLAIILSVAMLLSIGTMTVAADEASDIKAARDKADHADYFFDGYTVSYVRDFVCGRMVNEEDETFNKETYTQPYAKGAVEAFMADHFVFTDAMFAEVREALHYDADREIYDLPFIGGFGGFVNTREYVSHVKNKDGSYTLYYQIINWEELPQSEQDKLEQLDEWPETVTYNGKVYENGPEGYLHKGGYKDGGLAHTLDVKNGIARFISTENFTGTKVTKAPTTTTTKKPTTTTSTKKKDSTTKADSATTTTTTAATVTETVAQAEGLVIKTSKDAFAKDVVVKVEKIAESAPVYQTVETALKEVATKFVAYDITAMKNNTKVQPNGTVTATFDIPDDFDAAKVAVLYVSDDGKTEELDATVDAASGTVEAVLSHFSTYVVVEKAAAPVDDGVVDEDVTTGVDDGTTDVGEGDEPSGFPWGIVIAVAVIVLAGGAAAWYFLIYKKK